MAQVTFEIHFVGQDADHHRLDFYDAAHALVGFQRSLALTAHLVANGEIITQAPSLREVSIFSLPPEQGGWRTKAIVVFGTMLGGMAVAPHDTVAGNIAMSLYDFVLSESFGVHVDYNKTIGQLIAQNEKQHPGLKKISPNRIDSLVEKCEVALTEMHRPIVKSETAASAEILFRVGSDTKTVGPSLSYETYDYIRFTSRSTMPLENIGRISGYDLNTFKGRVYLPNEKRPVPFELEEPARNAASVKIVTDNLAANAQGRFSEIRLLAFHDTSRTGRLKRLMVVKVAP